MPLLRPKHSIESLWKGSFRIVLEDFDKDPIIPDCSNLRGIAQESKIVSEMPASFLAFKIHIVSGRSSSSKLAYS